MHTNENQDHCTCYTDILNNELMLALGCTEPIAIAYAAATARDTLGCFPEKMKSCKCTGSQKKGMV